MSDSPPSTADTLRLKSAAFRLKHDLGKYVRWNAPERRESDVEELRSRLALDLLATRKTLEGAETAVELFDGWRREEAALVSSGAFEPELSEVERAVDAMRRLLPLLPALGATELGELDEASAAVAGLSYALHKRIAARAAGETPGGQSKG